MFRPLCCVLFVGLATAALPAADDDPITLKDYKPKVGNRDRQTEEDRTTTRTVIIRDGKRDEKVEKKTKLVVFVSEALAVKDGEKKPVRVQRTYEKAEETTEEGTEKLPLHGLTVVIEKKDKKYTFTDGAGKPLPAKAEAVLAKEFEKKDSDAAFDKLIPKRPLKPGETWKLELDEIAKDLTKDQFGLDKKNIEGTGALARVYTFGGHKYGEFDLTMSFPMTEMLGDNPIKLKPGSAMRIAMHANGNVDGTEPTGGAVMRMSMTMLFDVPDGSASIRMDGLMSMTSEALPARKRD